MNHLLSLRDLTRPELASILAAAARFKKQRGAPDHPRPLAGRTCALIFSKSSTRTRVSFEVGIRELGGDSIFLSAAELQLGRGETEADTARVLSRYLHGVVIRTHAHERLEAFAAASQMPVINGLSDSYHPCQIIADLLTLRERTGRDDGFRVAFVGDGACNVARSWILATTVADVELRIAAPAGFAPTDDDLRLGANGKVVVYDDPRAAVEGVDAIYTDVWVSMGFEAEAADRLRALGPFRVDSELVDAAGGNASVMHCLPAHPGQEITDEVLYGPRAIVWDQAENRLHAQKAIMERLFADG